MATKKITKKPPLKFNKKLILNQHILNIENLKLDDDHWKVGLIEMEFQSRMFNS